MQGSTTNSGLTGESRFRYRAFISYSHEDRDTAKWLMRKLERYKTPARLVGQPGVHGPVPTNLSPVFRDREELSTGESLNTAIQNALAQSAALIVIASPNACTSKWVSEEIIAFKQSGSRPVFTFIIDGDPAAESGPDMCIPPPLRYQLSDSGEFGGRLEPLAADARTVGDGRHDALQKLIAGLLGVPLDDLVRRETQRRTRKLIAVAAVSLFAAAVSIVLAVTAIVAQQDATRRRDQAEDLLAFMVGDLRESLEPLGRLSLLERIGEKAMDYFATVDPSDVSDQGLVRQGKVMNQIGTIRLAELRYPEAISAFQGAHQRIDLLVQSNPQNAEFLFERAQVEYWMGDAAWRSGDLNNATNWFIQYRDSAIALLDLDPVNRDWIREVGYGHHNLGAIAVKTNRPELAIASFTEELQLLQVLSENQPFNDRIHDDVVDCLSWLSSTEELRGNLQLALSYARQSRELAEQLHQATPGDAGRIYWLSNVLALEHEVARQLDAGVSLEGLARAISLSKQLVEQDPDNRRRLLRYLRLQLRKLEMQIAMGDINQEVKDNLQDVSMQLEAISGVHGGRDEENRLALMTASRLKAQLKVALGISESDLEQLLLSLDQVGERPDAVNKDEFALEVSSSLELSGRLYLNIDQKDHAKNSLERARQILEPVAVRSNRPVILDHWSRILVLLNEYENAEKIRQRLETMGYKPIWPWSTAISPGDDPGS